jgi:two-component system phosphate regulon sensor histidine kinase PhoR
MKSDISKSSVLLIASAIAVVGLVIFQAMWMNHSRQQLEKTFDQQVCMAVCSALEAFGATPVCEKKAAHCSAAVESATEDPAQACCSSLPSELADDPNFREQLRQSLAFYQIDLEFEITQIPNQGENFNDLLNSHVVEVPGNDNNVSTASLEVTFPGKPGYLLRKLKWMIGATILIIGFTACVLLLANWMLRRQKRLLNTNKDFFNQMAHEFRTPLSNISLALQILKKKNQPLYNENLVQTIQKENDKLRRQVESILQMAQFENGDIQLQNEEIDLAKMAGNVQDELRLSAEAKGAIVDNSGISDQIRIMGDPEHLQNVLRNLVENAIKYSDKNPVIKLSTSLEDNMVSIQVKDNGPGIQAGDKDRIFNQFQRVCKTEEGNVKGFGLGLAYVKKIVELHNGKVWVESQTGAGCTFVVRIPGFLVEKTEKIHAQEDIIG